VVVKLVVISSSDPEVYLLVACESPCHSDARSLPAARVRGSTLKVGHRRAGSLFRRGKWATDKAGAQDAFAWMLRSMSRPPVAVRQQEIPWGRLRLQPTGAPCPSSYHHRCLLVSIRLLAEPSGSCQQGRQNHRPDHTYMHRIDIN
jgi:hypothetical protein